MIKFSERLKELRKLSNLSQTQLAKIFSVTRSSVNSWEMGLNIPTTSKLVEISEYFHVSIDYLLGIENESKINIDNYTEEQKEIIFKLITYFNNDKNTE